MTKGMDQNIGALHATNGMLDKDAHATQGSMGSLLLIAPWRVGVLVTLARLLRRDVNLLTSIEKYVREEEIARQFGEALQAIQIDGGVFSWIVTALKESHHDAKR